MRYKGIRNHLKPYSVVARRTTTINHAFAASIAPCDTYHEETVRSAMKALGQDPDADLKCAYCGVEAETWDHVRATVREKEFSGYGHRIGNLLPCCKSCNSRKGNKEWRIFLGEMQLSEQLRNERENRINAYLQTYCVVEPIPKNMPEYQQIAELKRQVLELFRQADEVANIIRSKRRDSISQD